MSTERTDDSIKSSYARFASLKYREYRHNNKSINTNRRSNEGSRRFNSAPESTT